MTPPRAAASQLGASRVEEEFFGRMQDLFGTLGSDSSLTALIAELASRLQGLATTPEDVALQTEVGNQANRGVLIERPVRLGRFVSLGRSDAQGNKADRENKIGSHD